MKTKPCKQCPFNKKAKLDINQLGGSHPGVYIGQISGPFWLPCHMDKEYEGKSSDPGKVSQCRGAAIFRNNLDLSDKMPKGILRLDKDYEESFLDFEDFLSHYLKVSREIAVELMKEIPAELWLQLELNKSHEIRRIKDPKL